MGCMIRSRYKPAKRPRTHRRPKKKKSAKLNPVNMPTTGGIITEGFEHALTGLALALLRQFVAEPFNVPQKPAPPPARQIDPPGVIQLHRKEDGIYE